MANLVPIYGANRNPTRAQAAKHSNYLDERAIVSVTITLNQIGQVYFRASYWNAACEHDVVLEPGTTVRVVGGEKLPLLVEPILNNGSHAGAKSARSLEAA